MGKATGVAAAIVRDVDAGWVWAASVKDELVRPPAEDRSR